MYNVMSGDNRVILPTQTYLFAATTNFASEVLFSIGAIGRQKYRAIITVFRLWRINENKLIMGYFKKLIIIIKGLF